jgi:tRNAThr (cytosine32-N3)-methyltransferase
MSPPEQSEDNIPTLSSLSITSPYEKIAQAVIPPQLPLLPSHRSHDPSNNQKRTDPFQFGSRYLLEDDDVFAFNAWDHVETDEDYKLYSQAQYQAQRENPVSDFDRKRFNEQPAKWWDLFYKNNRENFFKDRKWLRQEFPVLDEVTGKDAGPKVVLEVGAGAGNTAFPLLRVNENEDLRLHAVDFSKKAVDVMRANPAYENQDVMRADVWDLTSPSLPPGIEEGSVDVVVLVFVMSALSPGEWGAAVRNVWKMLKRGGVVLFRDYGRGDLAQVRFKKGRWMGENFYVRGDGTRVYFFERGEVVGMWTGKGKEEMVAVGRDEEDGGGGEEVLGVDEDVGCGSDKSLENDRGEIEKEEIEKEEEGEDRESKEQIFGERGGFEILDLGVDRRLLVNRQRKLKMYRCWLQGRFRKRG